MMKSAVRMIKTMTLLLMTKMTKMIYFHRLLPSPCGHCSMQAEEHRISRSLLQRSTGAARPASSEAAGIPTGGPGSRSESGRKLARALPCALRRTSLVAVSEEGDGRSPFLSALSHEATGRDAPRVACGKPNGEHPSPAGSTGCS